MLKLKNYEIEQALVQIVAFSPKTSLPVTGLLTETLSLGAKRRLQKLHTKLLEKYKEYADDIKEIEKECGDDLEKRSKEIDQLNNEEVTIDAEPVDLKSIEAITSAQNYDFGIIEKFAV